MASSFPQNIDVFINPTQDDNLNSVTVPHAKQHADANDAITAIQQVLGANVNSSFSTVGARIANAETQISSQSTLNGLSDVTISSVGQGNVLRYSGAVWVNYPEEDLVDGGNF